MMPSISRTLVLIAVIALLVIAIIIVGPAACNRIRSQSAQHRLDQGQGEALANSAADAVKTQGEANRREGESEALSRANEKDIRNAQGANDPVNPDANAAGLRALCRRAAYRDSERCRLLQPAAP
jgi:hypothetical protein